MAKAKKTSKSSWFSRFSNQQIIVVTIFVLAFGGLGIYKLAFSSAATPCATRTFTQGSKGTCVKYIQELTNWGAPASLKIDGRFDSLTTSAVQKFQVRMGLTANGFVGENTWYSYCYYVSQVPPQRIIDVRRAAGCDSLPGPGGA
jgi:hypothetical protein